MTRRIARSALSATATAALVGSVVARSEPALVVYAGVAALLSVALLVALAIPLRRALALEPATALRHT